MRYGNLIFAETEHAAKVALDEMNSFIAAHPGNIRGAEVRTHSDGSVSWEVILIVPAADEKKGMKHHGT